MGARSRAERARAERRRADEERLRIALELHDVLAHSISVINVQAGVGLALLDSDPEQARGRGGPVIRVVLADDQSLVRAGFRALLDAQPDITVAGEAADGEEALRLIRELRPDVVLMDIRMPALDGLAATRRVTEDPDLADVKVVMLTTFELDEYVFEAIRSGASGFLVKDTEPDELLRARIQRAVVDGDALLSPGVHAPPDRRICSPLQGTGRGRRPVGADRAGAGGDGAGRTRPDQRGDRPAPGGEPAHRENPRQPHHGEAGRP
ncbi:Protein-glutamate methylesterase/protein-glutamine glutaminase [Streptomyces griseoloalbus]